MSARKVIVFGPTGAVGSSTARTAAELGSHVVLAMRNTEKSIPGLDAATEKQGSFERVQADLTQPDTVRDAVTKTGAKYAFIYLAHGSPDHMKSTIVALKEAGVMEVMFLSSFTIQGDIRKIEQSDIISWIHAQVEIVLEEVYGTDGFLVVRPGSFASNERQHAPAVQKGTVKLFKPDALIDCIVPEDIGRVCGTILAKGAPADGNRRIYLYGPELMPQKKVVQILADGLGKEITIGEANENDARETFAARGVPPPLADYMIRRIQTMIPGEGLQVFGYPIEDEQMRYVEKYSGKKPTTFAEFVEKNKGMFKG